MKALLGPLSSFYGLLARAKNMSYDQNWRGQVELTPPVLSVGNLSMGGTGKTPVVQALVQIAQGRGDRVALISRNYKAQCTGPEKLKEREDGARYYGDEPYMLSSQFPGLDVFVGPSKSETAQSFDFSAYDLVIVDDGFQHRRLKRNFDLVLIDASAPLSECELLPQGRLREPVASLFQRAHYVLLTKCNYASSESLEFWRERLRGQIEFGELNYESPGFTNLADAQTQFNATSDVMAFSGLARSESFIQSVRAQLGAHIAFKQFPDHHAYSESEIKELLEQASNLITTEKDAIKLRPLNVKHNRIWLSRLELSPTHPLELIYEKAKRSIG